MAAPIRSTTAQLDGTCEAPTPTLSSSFATGDSSTGDLGGTEPRFGDEPAGPPTDGLTDGFPTFPAGPSRREVTKGPIVIVARTSKEAGRAARAAVHQDMKEALRAFWTLTGIDVRHLALSAAELDGRFAASPSVVSRTREGGQFKHRHVEVDYLATHGVYLLYTLGSGTKLDEHLRQPALVRVAEVTTRLRPSVLFAKHLYRFGRHPWSYGPIVTELNYRGGYLGDAKRGLRRIKSMESILLFFEAVQGEDEADVIVPRTRNGMRSNTGRSMVNGIVRVAASGFPPAGLARIRLRSDNNAGLGASVLVFDRPSGWPDPSLVAFGRPEVCGADGQPTDQVENVRWALSLFGTVSIQEIGEGLVARNFSTTGRRSQFGPSATFPMTSARSAANTIFRHVEFYRSGRLILPLGVEGFEDLVVDGCVPPDGPWAPPEVFERIDEHLADRDRRIRNRSRHTFGGHRATVNGAPAVLRGILTREGAAVLDAADPATSRAVEHNTRIPHAVLADAVVAGLAAAGNKALELIPADGGIPPELHRRLAELASRRQSISDQMDSLVRRMDERGDDGAPLVTGPLLARLNDDFATLAASREQVDAAYTDTEEKVRSAARRSRQEDSAVMTGQLLHLVESLRDPTDVRFRPLWRRALTSIEITNTPQERYRIFGNKVELTARLRLGDGHGAVEIPIRCEIDHLEPKITARLTRLVAEMREGTPPRLGSVPRAKTLHGLVAEHLDKDPKRFGLINCLDPRTLRIAMAICHPPAGTTPTVESVAAELDEPVTLVQRIHDIWGAAETSAQWQLPGAPALVKLHIAAALNAGTVHTSDFDGTVASTYRNAIVALLGRGRGIDQLWDWTDRRIWRLHPCPRCGSTRRAPTLNREVAHLLCLTCWHDNDGVEWPMNPYGHLIDELKAWQEHRLIPELGANPFAQRHHPRRNQRRHGEASDRGVMGVPRDP